MNSDSILKLDRFFSGRFCYLKGKHESLINIYCPVWKYSSRLMLEAGVITFAIYLSSWLVHRIIDGEQRNLNLEFSNNPYQRTEWD